MSAKVGASRFAGCENELIRVKDIPITAQPKAGDEMILCFGENPKIWDAIVALVEMPKNNGNCTVSVIDTNEQRGIRCPEESIFLQIEKRKLFVPKIFFSVEKK